MKKSLMRSACVVHHYYLQCQQQRLCGHRAARLVYQVLIVIFFLSKYNFSRISKLLTIFIIIPINYIIMIHEKTLQYINKPTMVACQDSTCPVYFFWPKNWILSPKPGFSGIKNLIFHKNRFFQKRRIFSSKN